MRIAIASDHAAVALKAALADWLREAGHEIPAQPPVLEINAEHPLVRRIEGESDEKRTEDLGLLLFDEARIAAGDQLDDPAAFVARVNRVLLGT